jgi:hypothetical protein
VKTKRLLPPGLDHAGHEPFSCAASRFPAACLRPPDRLAARSFAGHAGGRKRAQRRDAGTLQAATPAPGILSFLREIDKAVPAEWDIHCIADSCATHSHPTIRAWLPARPLWQMHVIATYRPWLNPVERFFSPITDKAIRRGSRTSVKQLVRRIDHLVCAYSTNCQPVRWTATADSIPETLHRLCSRTGGTGHSLAGGM